MEKKYEAVMTWLMNEANDEDILNLVDSVNAWNDELESFRYYRMEDMNELFSGVKPLDLLDKLASDFDSTQELFRDDVFGLESCNIVDAIVEIKDGVNEVVEAVINNWDNLNIPTSLEKYLEELEEE